MKANASLGSNMTYEKIEWEIQKYLKGVQEKDDVEDHLYGPVFTDDNTPTPASIAKGIIEVTLTPYGGKVLTKIFQNISQATPSDLIIFLFKTQ
jgi:hypothetical protein